MSKTVVQASSDTAPSHAHEEENESHFNQEGDFYSNDHKDTTHANFSDEDIEEEEEVKKQENHYHDADATERTTEEVAELHDDVGPVSSGHIGSIQDGMVTNGNDADSAKTFQDDNEPDNGALSRPNSARRNVTGSEEHNNSAYADPDNSTYSHQPTAFKSQSSNSLAGGLQKRQQLSPIRVEATRPESDVRRVASPKRVQSPRQSLPGGNADYGGGTQNVYGRSPFEVIPERNTHQVMKQATSSTTKSVKKHNVNASTHAAKSMISNVHGTVINQMLPTKSALPPTSHLQQPRETPARKHTEVVPQRQERRVLSSSLNPTRANANNDNYYPAPRTHIPVGRSTNMQVDYSSQMLHDEENPDLTSTMATTMGYHGESNSSHTSRQHRALNAPPARTGGRQHMEQQQGITRAHHTNVPSGVLRANRQNLSESSRDSIIPAGVTTNDSTQSGIQELLHILRMQQELTGSSEKKRTKSTRRGGNNMDYYGSAHEQMQRKRKKHTVQVQETDLTKAIRWLWAPCILWSCVWIILFFYCIFYFNKTAITAIMVLVALGVFHIRDFVKEMQKKAHEFEMSQVYTARKPIEFRMKYLHRIILCILHFIRKMILTLPLFTLVWYTPFVAMFSTNLWTNFDNLDGGGKAVCILHVLIGFISMGALYYALAELLRWVSNELREVITSIPGCKNILLDDIDRDVLLLPNVDPVKPTAVSNVLETVNVAVSNHEVRTKGNKSKDVHESGRNLNVDEQKDNACNTVELPLASPSAAQKQPTAEDERSVTNAHDHVVDFSSDSGSDSNDDSDDSSGGSSSD